MNSAAQTDNKPRNNQRKNPQSNQQPKTSNKPKVFVNKDAYERINYLYQAGLQLLSLQPFNIELVRYFMKCLCDIREKKVLRLTSDVRRSICDACYMLLVPGVTVSVKNLKDGGCTLTCLSCMNKIQTSSSTLGRKSKKRRKKRSVKKRRQVDHPR